MKRFFEIIGFISLVCFSFFYTEKIATVIKNNDDVLKQIENVKIQSKTNPIDAKIEGNTIIPGMSGKIIDVDKSYNKMKKYGEFNDNLLVYKSIKPTISITDNKDKYIIKGNNRRMVSLVFVIKDGSISEILNILNEKNIKATFMVSNYWFENNNQLILDLVNQGHNVGSLSTNFEQLSWQKSIVQKIAKQKDFYCYGNENLDNCFKLNAYTIEPTLKTNSLIEIKNEINNGYIISLDGLDNLNLIIDYIVSKGFDIVNMESLLKE